MLYLQGSITRLVNYNQITWLKTLHNISEVLVLYALSSMQHQKPTRVPLAQQELVQSSEGCNQIVSSHDVLPSCVTSFMTLYFEPRPQNICNRNNFVDTYQAHETSFCSLCTWTEISPGRRQSMSSAMTPAHPHTHQRATGETACAVETYSNPRSAATRQLSAKRIAYQHDSDDLLKNSLGRNSSPTARDLLPQSPNMSFFLSPRK